MEIPRQKRTQLKTNNERRMTMKIGASVKFGNDEAKGAFIRTFFGNFNSKNSLDIDKNVAEMELHFDKDPPKEIIDVIAKNEVIKFQYMPDSTPTISNLNATQGTTNDQPAGEQKPIKPKKEENDEGISRNKGKKASTTNAKPEIEIPELNEIAKKCTSYEEFMSSVCKWLDIEKRQEFFEEVIKAGKEADKVSWEKIFEKLEAKGLDYGNYDRVYCTKKVKAKFEKINDRITILMIIKAVIKYEISDFTENQPNSCDSTGEHQNSSDPTENQQNSSSFTGNQQNPQEEQKKNESEEEVTCFDAGLYNNLDEIEDTSEKIKAILNKMGLERKSLPDQQKIFKIALTATKSDDMDIDTIISKTDIPYDEYGYSRIIFSRFVNDYAARVGYTERIHLKEFLGRIKKNVSA